jgi:glycosyltransferase involved in cell wall biosynthesis
MANSESSSPDVTVVANDLGSIGGMERQLTELISGLLRYGHHVTVISWTCSFPPHPNLRWIRVPGPSRPFGVAYPLFCLLASFLVWLRGRGLVHSTGAIILNRTSVCTVHFCHKAVAELPTFSRASRPGFTYRFNARVSRVMSRMAERWCYRPTRAQRLVAVSEGVARELRRHFPKMRDRILVIPNGVDAEVFHPTRDLCQVRESGNLAALFVGSEWERKGLRVAIEALSETSDVDLIVVGDGDTMTYRELAEELSVGERVYFVGSTIDVASWYQRADVFLLPTAYETFSLVTYEAAASGLPLLVSKVNGVTDILRDGANGWFIDRDPEKIGGYLRTLQSDPKLRATMGEQARRDSGRFSWAQMVGRYRDLYRTGPQCQRWTRQGSAIARRPASGR